MPSAIERFLYGELAEVVSVNGEVGDHLVAELTLAENTVCLRIAPWDKPYTFKTVRFRDACLCSFSQHAAYPDELRLPWGIVGFYSDESGNGRWQFTLTCWRSRWCWESLWPEIEEQRAN